MKVQDLKAVTLTGRIAQYVPVIDAARARGVRWRQIRESIGDDLGIEPSDPSGELKLRRAYYRATVQIAVGRLRAGPVPGDKGGAGKSSTLLPPAPAKPAGGFKDVTPED